jgi:hypothetical protein
VAAGAQNAKKSRGLTPAGREKLRRGALERKLWLFSTGPNTPEGKRMAAQNGAYRQKDPRSERAVKRELAELRGLLKELQAAQAAAGSGRSIQIAPSFAANRNLMASCDLCARDLVSEFLGE